MRTITPVQQRAFTLVEILVALLLLSVGLMGLCTLQTRSLQTAQMAAVYMPALALSSDISTSLRANTRGVAVYSNPNFPPCVATSALCDAENLARQDRARWQRTARRISTQGAGIVIGVAESTALRSYTVTVSWPLRGLIHKHTFRVSVNPA